jgi:asparagine synthase (glutamine-hydrolysing)
MCGIGAIVELRGQTVPGLPGRLETMNELLEHRGPDGTSIWEHPSQHLGFAHQRLKIIDLETGDQPMTDGEGNWITYNGEIYNYRELRTELGTDAFRTSSDTEVVLRAYRRWGPDCVKRLRGMFAFAIWDEQEQRLFCARDRFGIKPLAYTLVGDTLYIASEAKALLPFIPKIETDDDALLDYLAFQFCLSGKTLFKGISELPAAHTMRVERGSIHVERYWEVAYEPDWTHAEDWFADRLAETIRDSISLHLRADVPVGSYLSGGFDSSLIATLSARAQANDEPFAAFTGRFDEPGFDEVGYARLVADEAPLRLVETTITGSQFAQSISDVIYHLDYPVAGPGAFPQFIVSREARRDRKVVLGGQGGDEIFGGYARYLLAYFEQCIKAAIDGTMHDGNFVVTYESIIPQLGALREYKPLMQQFWRDGLFDDLDARYFRLVDRAPAMRGLIDWNALGDYSPFETFREIFRAGNVRKESYFDLMTHFDFKTLLPALLHVEDRVSMAHGLESRVPFVDTAVVEFAATLPANVKFHEGHLKHALKLAFAEDLPRAISARRDKMGFPVPLGRWATGELRDFFVETLAKTRERPYLRRGADLEGVLAREGEFARNIWGLVSLELWQQQFHDRQAWWSELGRRSVRPAQKAD